MTDWESAWLTAPPMVSNTLFNYYSVDKDIRQQAEANIRGMRDQNTVSISFYEITLHLCCLTFA